MLPIKLFTAGEDPSTLDSIFYEYIPSTIQAFQILGLGTNIDEDYTISYPMDLFFPGIFLSKQDSFQVTQQMQIDVQISLQGVGFRVISKTTSAPGGSIVGGIYTLNASKVNM